MTRVKRRRTHQEGRTKELNDSHKTQQSQALRCAACDTAAVTKAKFCHQCGAALDGLPAIVPKSSKRVLLAVCVAATLSIIGATLLVALLLDFRGGEQGPAAQPRGVVPSSSVDLTTMTPLDAANRLFNRVMTASENRDQDEALRFAPMAVQAYGRVRNPDADAHYHLGLLELLLGNLDGVRGQIGNLKRNVPQHLLAMTLEHELAVRAGDQDSAMRVSAAFAAAYADEMAQARAEYAAHRPTLEKFHTATATPVANNTAEPRVADAAGDGEVLFEKHCATCHGRGALGTGQGPPLVNRIYEPGHHGDESFYRAVREGATAHHWPFGDMPPVEGVTEEQIAQIISYVRALQKTVGIGNFK